MNNINIFWGRSSVTAKIVYEFVAILRKADFHLAF